MAISLMETERTPSRSRSRSRSEYLREIAYARNAISVPLTRPWKYPKCLREIAYAKNAISAARPSRPTGRCEITSAKNAVSAAHPSRSTGRREITSAKNAISAAHPSRPTDRSTFCPSMPRRHCTAAPPSAPSTDPVADTSVIDLLKEYRFPLYSDQACGSPLEWNAENPTGRFSVWSKKTAKKASSAATKTKATVERFMTAFLLTRPGPYSTKLGLLLDPPVQQIR